MASRMAKAGALEAPAVACVPVMRASTCGKNRCLGCPRTSCAGRSYRRSRRPSGGGCESPLWVMHGADGESRSRPRRPDPWWRPTARRWNRSTRSSSIRWGPYRSARLRCSGRQAPARVRVLPPPASLLLSSSSCGPALISSDTSPPGDRTAESTSDSQGRTLGSREPYSRALTRSPGRRLHAAGPAVHRRAGAGCAGGALGAGARGNAPRRPSGTGHR